MKQNITVKQFEELSPKAKERLKAWWDKKSLMINLPSKDVYKAMSIGQMIEFIYQHDTVIIESEERDYPLLGWILMRGKYRDTSLVDGLWEWVKDILEKGEER